MKVMQPPVMLIHQKAMGICDFPAFSLMIHCTIQREKKIA